MWPTIDTSQADAVQVETPTRPRRERARSGDVLLVTTLGAIVVLGLFWATNNFAAAYGRGRAAELAAELPTRPMVVLDLEQQLYLPEGIKGVHQFPLPNSEGQRFRVRCQGLRLLTECACRKCRPCRSGGVVVLVEDSPKRSPRSPATSTSC